MLTRECKSNIAGNKLQSSAFWSTKGEEEKESQNSFYVTKNTEIRHLFFRACPELGIAFIGLGKCASRFFFSSPTSQEAADKSRKCSKLSFNFRPSPFHPREDSHKCIDKSRTTGR